MLAKAYFACLSENNQKAKFIKQIKEFRVTRSRSLDMIHTYKHKMLILTEAIMENGKAY